MYDANCTIVPTRESALSRDEIWKGAVDLMLECLVHMGRSSQVYFGLVKILSIQHSGGNGSSEYVVSVKLLKVNSKVLFSNDGGDGTARLDGYHSMPEPNIPCGEREANA